MTQLFSSNEALDLSSTPRNLEYFVTYTNKRGRVLIFLNLKGGECFFHSGLELSVISSNFKKGECNCINFIWPLKQEKC